CGTQTPFRVPQVLFLARCAPPSVPPGPRPCAGSSSPDTRCAPVRPDGRYGLWTERRRSRSRRTLFASGRTPSASAPARHTASRPLPVPANAVSERRPSLLRCSVSVVFSRVLSVILTAERSLHFQLRRDNLNWDRVLSVTKLEPTTAVDAAS